MHPTRWFLNVCSFFIVAFSFLFNRKRYNQVKEDHVKKIASDFFPVFTQELTKSADIKKAYDACKAKMAVPEWERFYNFLLSAEYLNESEPVKKAARQFEATYGHLKKLQSHNLATFFRTVSLPDAFDRAFIIVWLYTFHKSRMPDIKPDIKK